MITEERLKYFQKEISVTTVLECQFLMNKAGVLSGMTSSGLTTIQYKINSGTYISPSFPTTYAANDVIVFTYSYTDSIAQRGNIIIFGKDN